MYSQFQPGTSPQQPAYPWGQAPQQQPDFIDQATKILNFAEALRGRQQPGSQNLEQPSQYSVGQFQGSNPQQIGEQERRLAALGTSTQAFSPSLPNTYVGAVSNNLEQKLQQQLQVVTQGFQAALQELNQSYQVIDAIAPFMQVNLLLNQEIEQMDRAIAMLVPFVQASQIWANDARMHEQVLDNVCLQLASPDFLVYWAFHLWNQLLEANNEEALNWISDEYLNLLDNYEKKYIAKTGQHSVSWQRRQVQQAHVPIMGSPDTQRFADVPPMGPVPGGAASGLNEIEQLKQRIQMAKNATPDYGQQLQRQHIQQRQMMGGLY